MTDVWDRMYWWQYSKYVTNMELSHQHPHIVTNFKSPTSLSPYFLSISWNGFRFSLNAQLLRKRMLTHYLKKYVEQFKQRRCKHRIQHVLALGNRSEISVIKSLNNRSRNLHQRCQSWKWQNRHIHQRHRGHQTEDFHWGCNNFENRNWQVCFDISELKWKFFTINYTTK